VFYHSHRQNKSPLKWGRREQVLKVIFLLLHDNVPVKIWHWNKIRNMMTNGINVPKKGA